MTINGINGIDGINKIRQSLTTHPVKSKSEITSKDEVTISKEAKFQAELEKSIEIAKSAPDIRVDKVQEAKQKLSNNEYNTDEIRLKIAEKITRFILTEL